MRTNPLARGYRAPSLPRGGMTTLIILLENLMRKATTRTNRFVLASLGCLLVLLIVVGLGCRKQGGSTPEPNAPEPNTTAQSSTPPMIDPPAPTPAEPSPTVVTVNDEPVTEADVEDRLMYHIRTSRQLANYPPAFLNTIKAQLRPQVIQELVAHSLLVQEARAEGVDVTDDEALAALKERGAAQDPPVSVEQLKQMVESRGEDFEEVKADFKEGLVLTEFMEGKWAGKVDVNDAEAKAFYDENIKRFEEPEQIRASHILIRFARPADPNADPNEAKAEARAKAEDVLKQIKEGADFAELAKANPGDPLSAVNGGDLGFFPRGDMVPSFETAAFGLEPNAVSDLVESPYGYHIIKKTGHKDARTMPFEEARPIIITALESQKENAFVREYAESLKEKATIVYTPGNEPVPAMPTPMMTPAAPATSTPQTDQPAVSDDSAAVVDPNTN